ncbi:MAG: hypothetical protein Kapaf2KO_01620 [Candidatus Kapaibacteriales bacterium]
MKKILCISLLVIIPYITNAYARPIYHTFWFGTGTSINSNFPSIKADFSWHFNISYEQFIYDFGPSEEVHQLYEYCPLLVSTPLYNILGCYVNTNINFISTSDEKYSFILQTLDLNLFYRYKEFNLFNVSPILGLSYRFPYNDNSINEITLNQQLAYNVGIEILYLWDSIGLEYNYSNNIYPNELVDNILNNHVIRFKISIPTFEKGRR